MVLGLQTIFITTERNLMFWTLTPTPILRLCHVVVYFLNCFLYVLFIMHTCMSVCAYSICVGTVRWEDSVGLPWIGIYRQLCITHGGLNLHKFKWGQAFSECEHLEARGQPWVSFPQCLLFLSQGHSWVSHSNKPQISSCLTLSSQGLVSQILFIVTLVAWIALFIKSVWTFTYRGLFPVSFYPLL